jgi:hypothetical protein
MSAASYVGTILPQTGPLAGAKLFVNGVDCTPTKMRQVTPRKIGRNGLGRPFYQGTFTFVAVYEQPNLDDYQRLCAIFYPLLGSVNGTKVDLILPWIDQAGRFVEGTAYMEWPQAGDIGVLIESATVEFTNFRLLSEE